MAGIRASRLGFRPTGSNLGQQAEIWVLRLGFGSIGWDFGQQAGILASIQRFGLKALGGAFVMMGVTVHPCVLQDIGPLGPLPKKLCKRDLLNLWLHK